MSFSAVKQFESDLAQYWGSNYAVATDCCTHAWNCNAQTCSSCCGNARPPSDVLKGTSIIKVSLAP